MRARQALGPGAGRPLPSPSRGSSAVRLVGDDELEGGGGGGELAPMSPTASEIEMDPTEMAPSPPPVATRAVEPEAESASDVQPGTAADSPPGTPPPPRALTPPLPTEGGPPVVPQREPRHVGSDDEIAEGGAKDGGGESESESSTMMMRP
jgi:hypothetical protein